MASNNRERFEQPRELLVSWLSRLYRHRLTTTTGGNLSLVDDDGSMYITPSGGDKAIVPPEKIAVRKKGCTTFEGPCPPSMEHPLHTAAYEARGLDECRAVLHAHSQTLVAFSLAKESIDPYGTSSMKYLGYTRHDPRIPDITVLLGAYQACKKVAIAAYALPGSQELAKGCKKAFETGAECVILQNHGVVTIGKTLRQAYDRFISLEYLARSIVNAVPLSSPPKPLSQHILDNSITNDDDNVNDDGVFPSRILSCPVNEKGRIVSGLEKEYRTKLCTFVHRAYEQDLVTSSSGSFSVRLSKSTDKDLVFLITPTDVDRKTLEPADLCYISTTNNGSSNKNGNNNHDSSASEPKAKHPRIQQKYWFHPMHASGDPEEVQPSRAASVHATIYEQHPNINCIMVVQPPYATSYCITGLPFNAAGIPESHIILHRVQSIPLESILIDNGLAAAKYLDINSGKNTLLVAGYGLVTVGTDMLKTFIQVEVCESMCGVILTALRRGPISLLSKEQVDEVNDAFHASH